MSDEKQLEEMIEEMFDEYLDGGFDFDTSQSLEDIFKNIFTDAVNMTIAVLESSEEEEEKEE